MIDPTHPAYKNVSDNWELISQRYGVSSIEELLKKRTEAYRNMPSEKFADNFATDVLGYEPNLFEQLGSQDIEKYRSWPS